MNIPSVSSMFLRYVDLASHRTVTGESKFGEVNFSASVENHFSALDLKRWRIVRIIVVFKNDDL